MEKYKEVSNWLRESVEWLREQQCGCCTYKLNDRLAVCVGWSDGYNEYDECCIHAKDNSSYCITAGIKVWTSDYMRTDYDWINSLYDENGTVLGYDYTIAPNENYDLLAKELIKNYEYLKSFVIDRTGKVIKRVEEVIA